MGLPDEVSSPDRPGSRERIGLRAAIFDFYGTVACSSAGVTTAYAAVFARHGYRLGPRIEAEHLARYNGVEHVEHSTDQATYEAWVRFRHGELARAGGVPEFDVERVVSAMRATDTTPMVAYPDAVPTLVALRERGFRIGVCSNWGWELDAFVDKAGLLTLVDVAVTSAQAGARKPHPRIFDAVLGALGVRAEEALFVGDSLHPDVHGPIEVGMAAVHLWWSAGSPPELPPGAERITALTDLLEWPVLQRAAPPTRL